MKKIVLITGASRGIGKELAEVFAKNGYALILIARTQIELEALQTDLKTRYQCESKVLSIDLSKPRSVDVIIDTFKDEICNIDIVINNAGYGIAAKFTDTLDKDVEGILTVNIHALTQLTYRILPYMLIKKSGKILNVASTAAYVPGPYMSMYYASKAYVLSFSEALYEEYKDDGIIVSTLCPGVTMTSFQQRAGLVKSRARKMRPMTAAQVASIAYNDLTKNKRVIVTGVYNKIAVFLMWLIPRSILIKVTRKLNQP